MKNIMYGSVSALALLLAMQSGARADAALSTSVTDTQVNAAAAVLVDTVNVIDDLAFFAASGAFQVQQNNSVNSAASQNAAIDARVENGHFEDVGQLEVATSLNADAANLAVGAAVTNLNAISGDAFQFASGEFQVQQNAAINSTTAQNSAIGAISDSNALVIASQLNAASSGNADALNQAVGTDVVTLNLINAAAFEFASGEFQVQQNNSINSTAGQNMATSAVSDPRGLVIASQLSIADLANNVVANRALASAVIASNLITDVAFAAASGAFQVQQNNSINSSAQQNAAISAISAPGGAIFVAQASDARLATAVVGNLAIDDLVASTNTLTGAAFFAASGMFQVQQNNSINSAVSQNMAISATTTR